MADRLQELILYIAQRMEKDNHVGQGRIKLAKLLWRCDFAAYWKLGEPITGTEYHADKLGPAPAGELTATLDLQAAGAFEWVNEWDDQQLPRAKRDPNLDVFTAEQIALVDDQLERYRFVHARAMVDEAHEFSGWVHAWRDGAGKHQPIPYASVFWQNRTEPEPWENEYAAELAAELA